MDGLRQYIISVVTAALICGIVSAIVTGGAAKELVRLLCGVFLALTVIQPITRVEVGQLLEAFSDAQEGDAVAAMGENLARETMADIIKAETEAYILDKAAKLNAELRVEVTIGEDSLPISVKLDGSASPYARQQLESILETDLGITKENQLWTG